MAKKKEKTLLDKIRLDFKKIIAGNIILNILFLFFGLIIYVNPYIAQNLVGIIIGIYFILFGLVGIYEFLMRNGTPIFKYKIFVGILSIILGLFVIVNPFEFVKILTFALGLYLIIIALGKILETFKLKKYAFDGWVLMFVVSILLFVFGVFIAINPMASMDIIQVTGIFIALSSILEICNCFMIYGKANDIMKNF